MPLYNTHNPERGHYGRKPVKALLFGSLDGEATEGVGKSAICLITEILRLDHRILRLAEVPRIEGMEESTEDGGFLKLSLLDSSLGKAGRKWGKDRNPRKIW